MTAAAAPGQDRPSAATQRHVLDYRPEIDGLRAVAVIPVVLFHSGIGGMSGGFVGVDIFFVISGYLITAIIWRELHAGEFSIVAFYERRVRRIFPALAALLVAVPVAMAVFYLPRDFAAVPPTIAATLGFFSNMLFYTQTVYFNPALGANPLLHTWSLAVEEQYYLLFPIFMLLAWHWFRRGLVPMLVAITGLSFLLSAWGAFAAPTFTFYMAPTRGWELLAGSLVAIGLLPNPRSDRLRELLAALGLGLIFTAILGFDEDTPFPGIAALLPVMGSVLVIHCGRATRVGALLSTPILVFVGLISYSLYLWHWPILVFSEYRLGRPLDAGEAMAAIAASFAVAALSWRFVERPFRNRRRFGRRRLFAVSAMAAVAILAVVGAAQLAGGWPARFGAEARRIEAQAGDVSPRRDECQSRRVHVLEPDRSCVFGADVVPTVAMWGDSHAVELVAALDAPARRRGLSIVELTHAGCPPMLTVSRSHARGCLPYNRSILRHLLAHPELRTIILVMHADSDEVRRNPDFGGDFAHTAGLLARSGRRVILVHPVPAHPAPVPRTVAQIVERGGDPESAGVSLDAYRRRNGEFLAHLDRLSADGIIHVRPTQVLCRGDRCGAFLAGRSLYFDDDHLSIYGARLVAPLFEAALASHPNGP